MTMFKLLMKDKRFKNVLKIIETPKLKNGRDADKMNLNRLRALIYGCSGFASIIILFLQRERQGVKKDAL